MSALVVVVIGLSLALKAPGVPMILYRDKDGLEVLEILRRDFPEEVAGFQRDYMTRVSARASDEPSWGESFADRNIANLYRAPADQIAKVHEAGRASMQRLASVDVADCAGREPGAAPMSPEEDARWFILFLQAVKEGRDNPINYPPETEADRALVQSLMDDPALRLEATAPLRGRRTAGSDAEACAERLIVVEALVRLPPETQARLLQP